MAKGTGRRGRSRWKGYLVAVLILLAGWQITALLVQSPALPTPAATLPVFIESVPILWPEFLTSARRVVVSILLGSLLATPFALVCSRHKTADAIFAPFLFLTYPVPKVVFLPVLLILMGLGDAPKVALISIAVFFQVSMSVRDSTKAVPQSLIVSARSLGASRWQVYRHVIIPAVLPGLFTALRISSGTAIAILFVAESMAGTTGLGWAIVDAWGVVDYPRLFSGIIATALLGVLVYETIAFLDWRINRWTRAGVTE